MDDPTTPDPPESPCPRGGIRTSGTLRVLGGDVAVSTDVCSRSSHRTGDHAACRCPARRLRPVSGAEGLGGGGLRRGVSWPRQPTRPVRGDQGLPRWCRGTARRGRPLASGGSPACQAATLGNRGGARCRNAGRPGLHRLRLSRRSGSGSLVETQLAELARSRDDCQRRGRCARSRTCPVHDSPRCETGQHHPHVWRRPVLVDFGLALDDSSAGGGELGIVSGTPAYMAPEQVVGTAHRIDGRTDIYSLGVVLYEMLCGRIPFRSEQSQELLRQVRDDEPQPLRQIAREIPPELERICLKALAKKMQDRYTTAADFAEELRGVLLTTSESATPPSSLRQSAARQSATECLRGRRTERLRGTSRRRCPRPGAASERPSVARSRFWSAPPSCSSPRRTWKSWTPKTRRKCCRCSSRSASSAVRGLDGTVVQCNEQGFLACFGYPVAYEDAARRAARAGLRMLDELKDLGDQLRRKHQLELNPWVGIHTGPAVVETKGDAVSLVGEARMRPSAWGTSPCPASSFAPRTPTGCFAVAFDARAWAKKRSRAWPNRSSSSRWKESLGQVA